MAKYIFLFYSLIKWEATIDEYKLERNSLK